MSCLDVDEKGKNGHNAKHESRLIFLREWVHLAILESTCCLLQFEETLDMPDPKEALLELIDPRLGGDYPIDSVLKVSDAGKLGSAISFY